MLTYINLNVPDMLMRFNPFKKKIDYSNQQANDFTKAEELAKKEAVRHQDKIEERKHKLSDRMRPKVW